MSIPCVVFTGQKKNKIGKSIFRWKEILQHKYDIIQI